MDQLVGFLLHPPLSEIGKKNRKNVEIHPPLSKWGVYFGTTVYKYYKCFILAYRLYRGKLTIFNPKKSRIFYCIPYCFLRALSGLKMAPKFLLMVNFIEILNLLMMV